MTGLFNLFVYCVAWVNTPPLGAQYLSRYPVRLRRGGLHLVFLTIDFNTLYMKIFTDSSWYNGYINSMIYVTMNMAISLVTALPAAYAFSRYKFIGDKQIFFWLLTNRMSPAAVFRLPFF